MTLALVATVGHGSAALWYLTRATGLVSLILLSATVILGTVTSVGWTTQRWPRFLSQALHRNLSLFCLALLGVHIVSTIGDGYVPIGLADAFVPFRSPYRPLWVGLGALAFDLLLAVAITSGLRRRIGTAAWRGVHWLAYACWPIAVLHGLGSGTDARLSGATLIFVACVGSVTAAAAWRLAVGRVRSASWRLGTAVGGAALLGLIGIFAIVGPLRPGWSHRAGTSPALLAQLSGATASAATATSPSGSTTTTAPSGVNGTAGVPSAPFSTSVSGTVATSAPDASGDSVVTLTLHPSDTSTPLVIRIIGPAENGGVAMHRSTVDFGPFSGEVTALDGSNIGAVVSGPSGSMDLALTLTLDSASATASGQLTGQSGR